MTISHDEAEVAVGELVLSNDDSVIDRAERMLNDYIAQQRDRDAEIARLREALENIAKQRTIHEWKAWAIGEGLEPEGGDYDGAYDALVRGARDALAGKERAG